MLARINAELKANEVAQRHPQSVVLGADTLVVLDDKVFGKPRDLAEAREMLAQLCGRIHEVVTGVCLLHLAENRMCVFTESTLVKFRDSKEIDLDAYLADAQPLDKAGGYAAQDDNGRLIERLEGHMSNVIGLPVEQVLTALREHFPATALQVDTSEASNF